MRNRTVVLVFAASSLAFAAPLSLVACGGSTPRPARGPSHASSATSASATGRALAVAASPPPSGLPAMAPMPPPGVRGSKKATKKTDDALYACGAGATPRAKDPADLVKRLGESCRAIAKMKPVGPMIRGQQADRDAPQEHKLRVSANTCYRLVFATDENVRDAVVIMRDSAGDVVDESPSAALPEDGALCFTTGDEITLLVGIGAGKGAYAAQLWSN